MSRSTCITIVFLLTSLPASGGEWSSAFLTDTQGIEGRLGYQAGVIETGGTASWFDDAPDHLGGLGVFGNLVVTPDGAIPLRKLIPVVGEWLNLPETVPATIKLGGQVGIVNLAHDPQAAGGPALEVEIGPTLWSLRFNVIEGGDPAGEFPIDPGWQFWFGVKPIRFGKP